ncbi:hypothetical protein E2C01_009494 [Portunus trituberculatus]|uniref:Uncharacterized protein n=1 Tax=Portunus trituberculatus TaxID=210409 RepID=A0A5B7D5Y3_PORTR|nr:hypothetical protein [Portunus trituberculatus]
MSHATSRNIIVTQERVERVEVGAGATAAGWRCSAAEREAASSPGEHLLGPHDQWLRLPSLHPGPHAATTHPGLHNIFHTSTTTNIPLTKPHSLPSTYLACEHTTLTPKNIICPPHSTAHTSTVFTTPPHSRPPLSSVAPIRHKGPNPANQQHPARVRHHSSTSRGYQDAPRESRFSCEANKECCGNLYPAYQKIRKPLLGGSSVNTPSGTAGLRRAEGDEICQSLRHKRVE